MLRIKLFDAASATARPLPNGSEARVEEAHGHSVGATCYLLMELQAKVPHAPALASAPAPARFSVGTIGTAAVLIHKGQDNSSHRVAITVRSIDLHALAPHTSAAPPPRPL